MAISGLVALLILCVADVHSAPVLPEDGWQEARIGAVRKARDLMNKGREKKRLAEAEGTQAKPAPPERMKRKRKR